MKTAASVLRPLVLAIVATGLFITLMWLNVLYMDTLASHFLLSDKTLRLHRLASWILFLQLLLNLVLIVMLERAIDKRRNLEGPSNTATPAD